MIVAVLSDCHDHLDQVRKALDAIRDASMALYCGDYCAPFTLKALAEGFRGQWHSVFGNNDGDPFLLATAAKEAGNVTFHQPFIDIEIDGRRVAAAHYPQVGEALALSGRYAAVFSGHVHIAHSRLVGSTLWASPGEVMGRLGKPSLGLYDTRQNQFELRDLR